MRCKICGKENPDNVDLCFSCGSTLSGSASAEPTHSDLSQGGDFPSYFRAAWRQFARSPLAILFVLCYCAGLVITLLEWDAYLLELDSVLMSLGIWNMITIPSRKIILNVIHAIEMLPSILMAVGIWMICADAWDKKDRPIRLGGLKLVLALEVVRIAVLGLIFCIALIMARRAFLFVLVLAGLVMATLWIRVAVCITVRNTAQSCMPLTRYVKALAVIGFIAGGLNVLSILSGSTADGLGNILNCAMRFVLGALLLKYKELMDALDCKRIEMKIQSPEEPVQEQNAEKTEYVPAWKRVQMEKEKTEQ